MEYMEHMEYILYGLTNKRQHTYSPLVVFDKQGNYAFSQKYDMIGRPTLHLHDFKYIVEIKVSIDKVYVAKTDNDMLNVKIASGLPFSVSVKDKTYNGIIILNTCQKQFPYYRIPFKGTQRRFIYQRVSSKYKENKTQERQERHWINTENCSTLPKTLCVDSDGCTWNKKSRCSDEASVNLLPLRTMNKVMKPYKYYTFTEYELTPRDEDIQSQTIWFKPKGLWFAHGSEWLQHMKKTSFWMSKYNYLYEIQLNKDRICHINSLRELQEFSNTFGVESDNGMYFEGVNIKTLIDWKTAIKRLGVDGIVISPNIKKIFYKQVSTTSISDFFGNCEWYVTWDIASGAVWHKKSIKSVKLIYKKEEGALIPYSKDLGTQNFQQTLRKVKLST